MGATGSSVLISVVLIFLLKLIHVHSCRAARSVQHPVAPGALRDWPRQSCMALTKRLKVVSRNLTQWGLGNASDIAETSGHVHGVSFVVLFCRVACPKQAMAAPWWMSPDLTILLTILDIHVDISRFCSHPVRKSSRTFELGTLLANLGASAILGKGLVLNVSSSG